MHVLANSYTGTPRVDQWWSGTCWIFWVHPWGARRHHLVLTQYRNLSNRWTKKKSGSVLLYCVRIFLQKRSKPSVICAMENSMNFYKWYTLHICNIFNKISYFFIPTIFTSHAPNNVKCLFSLNWYNLCNVYSWHR